MLIQAWANLKNKFTHYRYKKGHLLSFSSHSIWRAGERDLTVEQLLRVVNRFAEIKSEVKFKKGLRFDLRSVREDLIVVVGVNWVDSESKFGLGIITVWNSKKDGEFYHHPENIVLDLMFTKEGWKFEPASEYKLQDKKTEKKEAVLHV